jgi:hypothetical protein
MTTLTWARFAAAEPALAAEGRRLFYQRGVGLGFLATIRADGGPRLHPVCLLITDDGLYAFVSPSPKQRDLLRDGRYALHAVTPTDVDDEFYVTGRVAAVEDDSVRSLVTAIAAGQVAADDILFEFTIDRCLHARYRFRGDWPPTYTTWRAE